MQRLIVLLRRSFTPITIMAVPHSKSRFVRVKIPLAAICTCFLFGIVGAVYVSGLAIRAVHYQTARKKLQAKCYELETSLSSMKRTEDELRGVFSLEPRPPEGSVSKDTGKIDMELMTRQVRQAVESIAEIKRYLGEQHDLFLATPAGLPVNGPVSSPFGARKHPETGEGVFHHGIDISVPPGTPVRATADGIVSFSGWSNGSGNVVVLEHGYGFNTAYAHNRKNLVRVGQQVKRGDVIVVSGATGVTTGPHIHYEVWRDGKQVNPLSFMKGR